MSFRWPSPGALARGSIESVAPIAVLHQAAVGSGPLALAAALRPPLQRPRHARCRPRHSGFAQLVAASFTTTCCATNALDCEFETRGLLFVFMTQAAMDHYAPTVELLRREFSVPGETIRRRTRSKKLEPALKPGLAGGWLLSFRCPFATRQVDVDLAPHPGGTRGDDSWRTSGWKVFSATTARQAPSVRRGRDIGIDVRRCDGRLDAVAATRAGLQHADPAGQRLLHHDAPTRTDCPHDPSDFPGDIGWPSRHVLRLSPRLDHGVRRL